MSVIIADQGKLMFSNFGVLWAHLNSESWAIIRAEGDYFILKYTKIYSKGYFVAIRDLIDILCVDHGGCVT